MLTVKTGPVPHTPPEVTEWFAAGYTSARMLAAGRQIINATMAAFPNQYVALAVASNGPEARFGTGLRSPQCGAER